MKNPVKNHTSKQTFDQVLKKNGKKVPLNRFLLPKI